MNQEPKEIKKNNEKLLLFLDNPEHKSLSIESLTEKEMEIVKLMLLQRINRQTLRTSKNMAFLVWMFIITLIIFIVTTQITEPLI